MNSTQIKCFLAVGRALNFTTAGRELYLAQSTVSKNVKALEKEIGVTLVGRAYHRVYLTEPGRLFFNRMTVLNAETEQLIASIQGRATARPQLRMGYTGIPFERKWVPLALQLVNLHTNYQLLPITIDPGRERHITSLVSEGRLDVMIIQRDIIQSTSDLAYLGLFEKGFSLVVTASDPLFNRDSVGLDDLVGRNLYIWNGTATFPAIESLKFQLGNHDPELTYTEGNDSATLISYVRAEMGICIVPIVLYNKADTDLRYIKMATDQRLSYGIIYPQDANRQPLIQAVNQQIKAAVAQVKAEF